MSSPIFSNRNKNDLHIYNDVPNPDAKLPLYRTKEELTCGLVNIPLTKPAQLFFIVEPEQKYDVEFLYRLFDINWTCKQSINSKGETVLSYMSNEELPSVLIKQIWHNFRTLRPRFKSNWRYPLWEIDTHDINVLNEVLKVYQYYKLPVFVHQSAKGFHFVCIKPVEKIIFKTIIKTLRYTNERYPPIALRLKANKYVNEIDYYKEGFIMAEKPHSDTIQIRKWITEQNIEKIDSQYMVVWYPFRDNPSFDDMQEQAQVVEE